MNTIENLAVEAPLFAKTLALSSINKVDPERGAKYQATGLVTPPVCRSFCGVRDVRF